MGVGSSLRHNMRIWAKKLLPISMLKALRAPAKMVESRAKRSRWEGKPELALDGLVKDLYGAGIRPGDTIMVHSSLSRIGNVAGGAMTVVESLIEAVTSDGTVIMPAYHSADEAFKRSRGNSLVDLRSEKSMVGKITEVFRRRENVHRSSHPFSSSCAFGKLAQYVTSGHATCPELCHADSPVGRLVELRGTVVGIGIPLAQGLGVAHYLEDTWDGFPFEVRTGPHPVVYVDADGTRVEREVYRYDPKVAVTRIDYPDGKWIGEKLPDHFRRNGILRPFRYGEADSWIMDARALYEELKRLAGKNVTMYLTEDRLTDINRDIENW